MTKRQFNHRFFIDSNQKCLVYVPQKCGWATYYRSLIKDTQDTTTTPLYKEDYDFLDEKFGSFYKVFHFRCPYSRLASAIADKFIELRDENFLIRIQSKFPALYDKMLQIKSAGNDRLLAERLESLPLLVEIIGLIMANLDDLAKFDPHFQEQVILTRQYNISLDWFDDILEYTNNLSIIKNKFKVTSNDAVKIRNRSQRTEEIENFLKQRSSFDKTINKVYTNDFNLLGAYL